MSIISKVGIVGAGQMGGGIAEVVARGGVDVVVREINLEALEAGERRVRSSVDRALSKGKLTDDQHTSINDHLSFTTDVEAFSDADLVIEAIVEDLMVKNAVFRELDQVCKPEAILATNTSSIPIIDVASATSRPERVVGLHFFNPAPVMELVEVIPSIATADDVTAAVSDFASEVLQKTVVHAKDRGGFIVNALLIPYLLSAIRMYEAGHATAEDIDTGMRLGCGHPMGPLALSDLIGLDTVMHVADSLYAEFRHDDCSSPPLVRRMVQAGKLGRKTGEGFFAYS
jgi:3-hydroxybutyryl-CoA dehydrogenase